MKITIIILSVLLVVAVLTILAMWAAVAEWRTECNQWHTDAKKLQESNESLKAMYENECRHRAWALSQLKAQTTRADYLQGELDKATRLLNVAEWRKNKKNNKKTKDNGKQSKADSGQSKP